MEISKDQVLELIRSHGDDDKTASAQAELPDQVDTDRDAGLLERFGVDPLELLKKFGGGNIPGL